MKRREFTSKTKTQAHERSGGKCENDDCGLPFSPSNPVEYDHVIEAYFDGSNSLENCKAICKGCHSAKTRKQAPVIAKSRRIRKTAINARTKRQGFRGWRKFNGEVVWK